MNATKNTLGYLKNKAISYAKKALKNKKDNKEKSILERALNYAYDVVNGVEITTKDVENQCLIFLDDYENKQYLKEYKFYADHEKFKVIENLLKFLNFPTGFVAGKPVYDELDPFQCFLLVGVFLFRFKNNPKKFKHNDIILFIARKNAKTSIVAVIFIILMMTEQKLAEFYSICKTKELAAELRKAITQMIEASPYIKKHFKISKTFTGNIECKITGCFYQPRVSEAGKNNSVRPSCICSDEHANFKEASNFNALKGGMKNVINPIVFRTTTAYAIDDSIMEEDLTYARSVLDGTIDNPRQFALLYYAEEGNEWNDMGLLQANPLRNEENYQTVIDNREKAKVKTSEQEEYLTKEVNVFVAENQLNKYLDFKYWKPNAISLEEFKERIQGKKVKIGVDMSVTTDLTAVGIEFEDDGIIYCHSKGFLPRESLSERREKHINYNLYEKLGYCNIHDGMTVNYSLVEKYIREIEEIYNCEIDVIVTDPSNAKEMMERLSQDFDVVMLKQTYTQLSPPTKEFRKNVYDGKVRYVENKLLDWNVKNSITSKGKADDEMLQKENKNKQRIDMLVVLVFAFSEILGNDGGYDAVEALDQTDW